jgi:hypothetical protein
MRAIGWVVRAARPMTRRCWPELNRSSQRGVCSVTLRVGTDNPAGLAEAAVVVEARPEGGPERR